MRKYSIQMSLRELCGLFGITRQAWYKHQNRREAELINEGKTLEITRATRSAHEGLARISAKVLYLIAKPELVRNVVVIGRDKFFEVLRKYGLIVKRKRMRVRTTFSDVNLPLFPNLAEGMEVTGAEQLWVSDITYLRVGDRFAYLTLITDAYSRRIMGWHLSETLEAAGCVVALEMALSQRSHPLSFLVHHSDRGFQYRSQVYLKVLRKEKIESSMTQTGDPLENAIAERVNGILKVDMGLALREYQNIGEAREVVEAVIHTYNHVRPHSSVENLTPALAHHQSRPLRNLWKKQPRQEVASV